MRNQKPMNVPRPQKSKLRILREAQGLTLTQLAEKTGLNYSGLSRVERHRIRSLHAAKKLVQFFGPDKISLDDILFAPEPSSRG